FNNSHSFSLITGDNCCKSPIISTCTPPNTLFLFLKRRRVLSIPSNKSERTILISSITNKSIDLIILILVLLNFLLNLEELFKFLKRRSVLSISLHKSVRTILISTITNESLDLIILIFVMLNFLLHHE